MTQEQFVAALEKLPDYMISNLVEYIESGKQFAFEGYYRNDGRGCVARIALNEQHNKHEQLLCMTPIYKYGEETRVIPHFNDANYDKPILYQLILREAEKRGMIKKELEPIGITVRWSRRSGKCLEVPQQ